jgi:hypothetical protein
VQEAGSVQAAAGYLTLMASDNPFQTRFQSLAQLPTRHAESVNQQAYRTMYDLLSVPLDHTGRCVLLRAPRAGYGKTHLLARLRHYLGASHEFVAVQPGAGSVVDAGTVMEDILRRLLRALPAAGGMTVLDLVSRRLLAMALQPLVRSGEVPCQDREGALAALQIRPVETFDFHHPNAVTARWTRDNFSILGPRLSLEVAQYTGLSVADVAFWMDVFFRYATSPLDHPTRAQVLVEGVRAAMVAGGFNLLVALLVILTRLTRVVLLVDDLEGFSADQSAALRLASFLGVLRQNVERLDVVLSVNQDVWESAFAPRMSGGLSDRLSEVVIDLKPLTPVEIMDLLESRAQGRVEDILREMGDGDLPEHSRGVIQAVGGVWDRMGESKKPIEPIAVVPPPDLPVSVPTEDKPFDGKAREGEGLEDADIGFADMQESTEDFVLYPDIEAPVGIPPQVSQQEKKSESLPNSVDQDRVDELLRQFRERYGK